jgi:uncharacterized protein (TIGR03118 family)
MKINHMQSNTKSTATASMFRRALKCFACMSAAGTLLLTATSSWAAGGPNAYHWTNLVSDIPGVAENVDPNLVNPWGLTISSSGNFWVSDAEVGLATVYSEEGVPQSLVVTIPPSASSSEEVGAPTGQVVNSGPGFVITQNGVSGPSLFIFVSEDGGISGWNPEVSPDHAILAVDDGDEGAVYKGATLASTAGGDFLYVTNFHEGTVDVYDQNFAEVSNEQTFVDPTIPHGFAPFGIQNINGLIYVTYAKQDADKVDDVPGPGFGFVSVFDTSGNFIKRLISRGHLNAPWGLALAPAGFGRASNSLLVGNFGDGRINIFDINSGASAGPLRKANGTPLAFDGLWALLFVDTDLYFTAGIADEEHGLFGEIEADE